MVVIYDAQKKRELALKKQRMLLQQGLQKQKIKAQNEAIGFYDESEQTMPKKSYEEQESDFNVQLAEASKNVYKLMADRNEASKLLEMIIQRDDIVDFNENFPRIFREIKTNFKNEIGAARAFQEIVKVINTKSDEPLDKDTFITALKSLYNMIDELTKDDIMKLQALELTYKSVNAEGKDEMEKIIDTTQDPSEVIKDISQFVLEGGLQEWFDNYNNPFKDAEDDDEFEDTPPNIIVKPNEEFTLDRAIVTPTSSRIRPLREDILKNIEKRGEIYLDAVFTVFKLYKPNTVEYKYSQEIAENIAKYTGKTVGALKSAYTRAENTVRGTGGEKVLSLITSRKEK